MDRHKLALHDALKIGAQERAEMRLYKRGKLPGLFAQRTRANAELANQAIADGLLEITRVETVGKTTVEWVRVTTKGLDQLLADATPKHALEELRELLTLNQDGFPKWVADMNAQIRGHMQRYADEVTAMRQRLEQLARRVEEALGELNAERGQGAIADVPWEQDALDFLLRRQHVGLGARCPLGDLFEWLRDKQPTLTIMDYHAGLKRLEETQLVTLHPGAGPGDTPGPEYALLVGSSVYYYVAPCSADQKSHRASPAANLADEAA